MAPILEIRELSKQFGEIKAVDRVSMSVEEGQIAAIIGPNGAGKTTLFNLITNTYRATSGQVLFRGRSTLNQPEFRLTEWGIARTYQNIRLFDNMTALDNVKVGMHCRTRPGVLGAALATPWTKREERSTEDRALELMEFVGIGRWSREMAKNLPYGGQRRLEIARALATEPKLLLLDEPAAGMNPQESQDLMGLIRRIRATGVTVLLIEHHMKVVMGISERIVVLNYGAKIAEGTPVQIQNDPLVIEAYLGTKRETGFARSRRHRDEVRTDSGA
ncbi:MAG: ABC transporter ATP-binding protein [Sphingomonadaceae bacterium]